MGRADLLEVESLLHLKQRVFPESRGGRMIPLHTVLVAACSFNTTVIADITVEKKKNPQNFMSSKWPENSIFQVPPK